MGDKGSHCKPSFFVAKFPFKTIGPPLGCFFAGRRADSRLCRGQQLQNVGHVEKEIWIQGKDEMQHVGATFGLVFQGTQTKPTILRNSILLAEVCLKKKGVWLRGPLNKKTVGEQRVCTCGCAVCAVCAAVKLCGRHVPRSDRHAAPRWWCWVCQAPNTPHRTGLLAAVTCTTPARHAARHLHTWPTKIGNQRWADQRRSTQCALRRAGGTACDGASRLGPGDADTGQYERSPKRITSRAQKKQRGGGGGAESSAATEKGCFAISRSQVSQHKCSTARASPWRKEGQRSSQTTAQDPTTGAIEQAQPLSDLGVAS